RPFGEDLEQLDGPHYAGGYLPIVQTAYTQGKVVYEQEAFAGVREPWAAKGTVLLRFRVRRDTGVIRAQIDLDMAVTVSDGTAREGMGRALVLFDAGWKWDGAKKELTARLAPGSSVVLAVLTEPLPPPFPALTQAAYDAERKACADCWETLLGRGTRLEIP